MSATVKLSAKLPGEPEINGVDSTVEAHYDVAKVTHDVDLGTDVPTIRVRRIEPLGLVGDVPPAVRKAVAAAEEARTGRKAIPFEIVEVGEHAFGDPLPEGE